MFLNKTVNNIFFIKKTMAYLNTENVSFDPRSLSQEVPYGNADAGEQAAQVSQSTGPIWRRHFELHQPTFRRHASF